MRDAEEKGRHLAHTVLEFLGMLLECRATDVRPIRFSIEVEEDVARAAAKLLRGVGGPVEPRTTDLPHMCESDDVAVEAAGEGLAALEVRYGGP